MVLIPLVALVLAASSSPLAVVKEGNAEVQQILSTDRATVEQLATAVDRYVDFSELARRALGKEWDNLSKKQQQEFSGTVRDLLRVSYAQKALGQGTAEVQYGEEKLSTGQEAEVTTTITVNKDPVPVVYKLYRGASKAGWRIYDVVTDGFSLLENYRSQFRKIIASKGYDGLLAALKAKRTQQEGTVVGSASGAH